MFDTVPAPPAKIYSAKLRQFSPDESRKVWRIRLGSGRTKLARLRKICAAAHRGEASSSPESMPFEWKQKVETNASQNPSLYGQRNVKMPASAPGPSTSRQFRAAMAAKKKFDDQR